MLSRRKHEWRRNVERMRIVRLLGGLAMGLVVYLLIPEQYVGPAGELVELGQAGRICGGLAAWMACWWLTEAIPLWATALLPLLLLPVTGTRSIQAATAPYFHPLIFLFLGGFILALSMERWGLHKRFALGTLRVVGTRPRNMVAGFMGASALLSMWVSNTATTMMMLPIAISVLALTSTEKGEGGLDVPLLLGVAYGASIGGIGTLIGTPPNLFLASYARDHLGTEISFVGWMAVGLPLVALFLPLAWLLLTRVLYPLSPEPVPGVAGLIAQERQGLGTMGRGEKITLVVFVLTAAGWITRPLLPFGISDTAIALAAATALFVIPVDFKARRFAMDFRTAARVPWGILLLFGGGLSLAAALDGTGVAAYLGVLMSGLGGLPAAAVVVTVTALVIFLTELTSNTATAATLIPILASIAPGLGMEPMALAVPATLAASCAFMMPVATPPNAIVFGSGRVTIRQMTRAGLWLNLAGIAIIGLVTFAWL
jgi:solute carrier family 13 (sodium-dependent dicarboxylate transporter), member 2/3/5